MSVSTPIYLDHAATSAPKPKRVAERVYDYLQQTGISAGRGSYRRSISLGQEIAAARAALATLIQAESVDRILFTSSGTEGLNLILLGLLQQGGHVITTVLEHNSVLRPLAELVDRRDLAVTYLEPDASGRIDPAMVAAAIRPETKLICCVHASNVMGRIQPVEEICRLAREREIPTLIDAAQSVGHLPLNVQEIGCDFLVAPCHKGLLAPLGTGFVYLRKEMEQWISPLMFGGTGTQSELATQPQTLPAKYESGSLNVPGLLGLAAALGEITPETVLEEHGRLRHLHHQLIAGLIKIDGVQLYGIPNSDVIDQAVPVVSLNVREQDPRVISTILDEHFQIEVRSGFHCAPKTHQWLQTHSRGGTIRLSLGHTTTTEQIEACLKAIAQIAASF